MADQIKVNDAAWKALPQEHKDAISEIIGESFGKVSIVGDPTAAAPAAGAKFSLGSLGGFCKLICQLVGSFAHSQCKRLPAGPAQAICNAAADAAEKLCEGKCH